MAVGMGVLAGGVAAGVGAGGVMTSLAWDSEVAGKKRLPQEEKDGPSQSLGDRPPPPGTLVAPNGTFAIAPRSVFKYMGDSSFQDCQQCDVARVVGEDGSAAIMKRPKYTRRDWEDNLQKECFVARYLNRVGLTNGIANCIGERIFGPEEVEALKASRKNVEYKKEYDNNNEWHVILLEQPDGKSFKNAELSLVRRGREDSDRRAAEKKAVHQIIQNTGQMLKAGIVNVNQWHNILVSDEGQATFIGLDAADFLSEVPLQVFLAPAGKDFKHEVREMKGLGVDGKWEVTQVPPPKVLKEEEADRKVKAMVKNIFGLVPRHAVLTAEKTLESRQRLGNSLDDIVDKAWTDHKSELESKWSRDKDTFLNHSGTFMKFDKDTPKLNPKPEVATPQPVDQN